MHAAKSIAENERLWIILLSMRSSYWWE